MANYASINPSLRRKSNVYFQVLFVFSSSWDEYLSHEPSNIESNRLSAAWNETLFRRTYCLFGYHIPADHCAARMKSVFLHFGLPITL